MSFLIEAYKGWSAEEAPQRFKVQCRQTQIELRLLSAFHDAHLELHYEDVSSYALSAQPHANQPAGQNVGHGDRLIDEVRLSENNLVLHEILFSDRGRWQFYGNGSF